MNGTLTDIPGFRVGHAHDHEHGITGCTVVLCPPNTIGGVDQRGGSPGTRETDILRPLHRVEEVHGVFMSGGSAYGLAVGDGVMRFLEEAGIGYQTSGGIVPIVPGAILYDLDVGGRERPTPAMGYKAADNASDAPVMQGSVGAGTGAKIGGMLGPAFATKGGIGSASMLIRDEVRVAALFAVNSVGDILNEDGTIMAGLRQPPDGTQFANMLEALRTMPLPEPSAGNTVIGVIATNAILTKDEVNKVAQMAHDGLARAVNPAHTPYDGDTIFALASGEHPSDASIVGAFAAEVTAQAIRNAIREATSIGGILAMRDL
jgi:L-aminopeptidase/D-esterase-like protein